MSDVRSDGKGGTTGTITFLGDGQTPQVLSLAFSGDGKILAVGALTPHVDLWNMESRKKLCSFQGGPIVGLSPDGHVLADDRNGIVLRDVSSGRLLKTIPRVPKRLGDSVEFFVFSPDGSLLNVTANGRPDEVYEVATGRLVATLDGTYRGQFSRDGSLLADGPILWNTKNWTKVSERLTVPDFVTGVAAFPEKDIVLEGGSKVTSLLQLQSSVTIANFDTQRINFAAFDPSGTLVFTNSREKFAVWDLTGKEYCSRPDIGRHITLSWDGRWLAAVPNGEATSVTVWSLQKALPACGVANPQ